MTLSINIQKNIIRDLFTLGKCTASEIFKRLMIIDRYYSTQTDKRLFGVDEIADHMISITNSDQEMIKLFLDFFEKPNEESVIYYGEIS